MLMRVYIKIIRVYNYREFYTSEVMTESVAFTHDGLCGDASYSVWVRFEVNLSY